MIFEMKKNKLVLGNSIAMLMCLRCFIIICFLSVGCKKGGMKPVDEKVAAPTLELSNNDKPIAAKAKQPSDAGWADGHKDPRKLRSSVGDVFSRLSFGFTLASHVEEGEIKNVQLNQLLQKLYGKNHGFKEVHAKNLLVGTTTNGSLTKGQFIEAHYYENKRGQIFGLKTIFGHQPGGAREYGKGSDYVLNNGPYYKPSSNSYPYSGRLYFGCYKQMSYNMHHGLPRTNNIRPELYSLYPTEGAGSNQGHSSSNNGSTGNQGSNDGSGN